MCRRACRRAVGTFRLRFGLERGAAAAAEMMKTNETSSTRPGGFRRSQCRCRWCRKRPQSCIDINAVRMVIPTGFRRLRIECCVYITKTTYENSRPKKTRFT